MESPGNRLKQYAAIATARRDPAIQEQVEEILTDAQEEFLLKGSSKLSLVATLHAALVEAGLIK